MNKVYNYSGSKARMMPLLNNLISQSKTQYYYEPFLGSGIVFLNLQKQFDEYYLNDVESSLMLFF
jgi:site-specific DNA-adenine methylase